MSRHGRIIWLTGLPGVGKTTVAKALLAAFAKDDIATLWLDSDALRKVITPDAQYDKRDRDFFYGVVGHLALLGAEGGVTVVISATAPKQDYRDRVRAQAADFVEVWLTCSPETLRRRDIKGLYAQSETGTIKTLPGQGSPYEAPPHCELTLLTDQAAPDELVRRILAYKKQDTP